MVVNQCWCQLAGPCAVVADACYCSDVLQ
jgi:hypothetical protein